MVKGLFFIILFEIFLSNCAVQKEQAVDRVWFSGYELEMMYGKEKANEIIKQARVQWTRKNKTNRDNMRTGNIEYNVSAIKLSNNNN